VSILDELNPKAPPAVDPYQLNFAITAVQVSGPQGQQEIRLLLQCSDIVGLSFNLCLSIPAARSVMYALRDNIEKAETTIIKPPSAIASA